MNIATFVPSIPASLSERLIWRDNSFHASEELKGDNELDTLFFHGTITYHYHIIKLKPKIRKQSQWQSQLQ